MGFNLTGHRLLSCKRRMLDFIGYRYGALYIQQSMRSKNETVLENYQTGICGT